MCFAQNPDLANVAESSQRFFAQIPDLANVAGNFQCEMPKSRIWPMAEVMDFDESSLQANHVEGFQRHLACSKSR